MEGEENARRRYSSKKWETKKEDYEDNIELFTTLV